MGTEKVEGPVYTHTSRGPTGTRIQIDVPVRTSLALNGFMFVYSGYFLYQTLKGLHNLNLEVPQPC